MDPQHTDAAIEDMAKLLCVQHLAGVGMQNVAQDWWKPQRRDVKDNFRRLAREVLDQVARVSAPPPRPCA